MYICLCVCACSMTFVCRFIVATAIECPFRKIYDECTVFHFKTKCNWDVSSWSVHSSLCAYNTNKATSESSMQVNCFQMGLFEAGWSIHLRARNLMMLFIFVSVRSCIHFFFHFFFLFLFVRCVRFYVMVWESKRQKDGLESIEHKTCHHRFWFATQRLNLLYYKNKQRKIANAKPMHACFSFWSCS